MATSPSELKKIYRKRLEILLEIGIAENPAIIIMPRDKVLENAKVMATKDNFAIIRHTKDNRRFTSKIRINDIKHIIPV